MKRVLLITLIFLLLALYIHGGEEMTRGELEQSIYILRWAIARLSIEMMDILIEVQRSDVSPELKGRAETAIGVIYQILEILGVRIEA